MWESARLSTPQAISDSREIIIEIMESSIPTRSGIGHVGLWSPYEAGQAMILYGLSIFDFFDKKNLIVILLLSCCDKIKRSRKEEGWDQLLYLYLISRPQI